MIFYHIKKTVGKFVFAQIYLLSLYSMLSNLDLTYHVNLKLSTRQTAHTLKEVNGIDISHTMVAKYTITAATITTSLDT